jgi:tetratricopeptide (TPR) repeat protein
LAVAGQYAAAGGHLGDAGGVGGDRVDFFISHSGSDRAWAEWVAWQLTEAGYTVELDVWDWAAGQNFITKISDALERCDRVVALWSAEYFTRSRYTTEEWSAAAVRLPSAAAGRLVPLRVEDLSAERVPGILRPLVYKDVFGLDQDHARQAVLEAVRGPARPGQAPEFPGRGRAGQLTRLGGSSPRLPGALPGESAPSDTAADSMPSFGVTIEHAEHVHVPTQQAMAHARLGRGNAGRGTAERLAGLPPRNPHFAGRSEKLAQLGAMLDRGSGVVAIHGLGGVGKSQLAQEYAHTRHDRYQIIWWVRAGSHVELVTDLVKLGRALGLAVDTQPEHVINAVRAQLGTRQDWLLIFDNVSDVEAICEVLPVGNGHVLITSRIRHWTGVARTCPLEELPPHEAAHYLRASTGRDAPEIAELARELGYLPLALAQAAGYVAVHNCSLARYLELYHAAAQRTLLQGPPPHGYPATVATTWRLHFESLPCEAIEVLRLVAFLAPDAIPLRMLLDAAPADELPEALRGMVSDLIALEAAIGELVNTSLLDRLDDDTVRVHVLVQEVTRAELPKKQVAIWTSRVISIIDAGFPEVPWLPESWQRASMLAPHAEIVAMRVKPHQTKITYPAAKLLYALGTFLDGRGQYEAARRILARSVTLAEASDTPKRLREAFVLTSQGANLLHLHDYIAAAETLNKALRIYDAALHPINPFVTRVLVNLAVIATAIEDYPGAR